uniref:Esterase n=2 Tax=Ascaris TaxID=6251 RepID=F1L8X1_ASCSU
MGGNAECHWAVTDANIVAEYCLRRAKKLGWQGTENNKMMDYLRNVPDYKFGDTMIGNKVIFDDLILPLTPVIDGDLLPAPIRQLREDAHPKPTIIGVTENEGLLFTAIGRMACDKNEVERSIRRLSMRLEGSGIDIYSIVKVVYGYDEQKTYSRRDIKKIFVMMIDDVVSNYACATCTSLLVKKHVPVYMFSFEHFNPCSYGVINCLMPFSAPTHATELNYLFDANVFVMPYFKTSDDRRVSNVMTRLWTSFVKYGDPNKSTDPTDEALNFVWEAVSEDEEERHLRISKRTGMRTQFKQGRLKMLRGIIGDK